jgi:Ca-activated chloride channel family protein
LIRILLHDTHDRLMLLADKHLCVHSLRVIETFRCHRPQAGEKPEESQSMDRRTLCQNALLQIPLWAAFRQFDEERIDQAICCLVDASESVRAGDNFFNLQKAAIASALRNPCVTWRLLTSADARSAFALITWASAAKQIFAIPWTVIRSEETLHQIVDQIGKLSWPYSRPADNQTGLGMAIFVALEYFSLMNSATRKIINVSSNGINNDGLEPRFLKSRILRESIEVNSIIMPGQAPSTPLEELESYYSENVTTGAIQVPVPQGRDAHGRFVSAMVSKFCAELVEAKPVVVGLER